MNGIRMNGIRMNGIRSTSSKRQWDEERGRHQPLVSEEIDKSEGFRRRFIVRDVRRQTHIHARTRVAVEHQDEVRVQPADTPVRKPDASAGR